MKATINIFVTFMLVSMVLVLLVSVTGATWCDNDYAKRIDINVNNTGGGALTDYQVYVNLSANPINETSLRVYNATSCSIRPHWCEETSSGNCTKLWINYSSINASTWINDTSIYYDNVSASSTSSIENTFIIGNDGTSLEFGDDGFTHQDDIRTPGYPNDFDLYDNGNRLILAEYAGNIISLYNSTDKTNLQIIDSIAVTDAHDVRVIDGEHNYGYYVNYGGNTFGILNLTDENNMAIEDSSTLTNAFYCRAYNISGNLTVFVVNYTNNGLTIYNVTNHSITMHDSITGSGTNYDIREAWRVVYHPEYKLAIVGAKTDGTGAVSVFDASNLSNIVPKAKYSGAKWKCINLFIEGNKVYGTASGIDSIEVSTINSNGTLTWLGNYTSSSYLDNAHGIFVNNSIIYAADWWNGGITTLNATDPTDIIYVSSIMGGTMAHSHATEEYNNYIFIADATYGAGDTSSGINVYLFNESNITTSEWTVKEASTGSGTWIASNGVINVTASGDTFSYLLSDTETNTNNYTVAAKIRAQDGSTDSNYQQGLHFDITQSTIDRGYLKWIDLTGYDKWYLKGATVSDSTASDTGFDAREWHKYEFIKNGSSWHGYVDETLKVSRTEAWNAQYTGMMTYMGITGHWANYDDFRVRKYAYPEPLVALDSEEQQAGGTTPVISNVVNGSISSTSQYIDWDVNQTAANRVLYSNKSDLTPAWYSTWDNSTNTPNITLSSLTASTQYWYQAWSYNTTNTSLSDNSSTMNFTTAAESTYIPPDPTTLANTTGNFWINHTWNNGTGNVTNSYNVSVNTTWYNTTTNEYYNNTGLSAHGWSNISTYAFNSTGTGTLSNGNVSQDTQVPNNAISISNCSNKNVIETQNVYVDIDSSDTDGDTPTYSCNRTDLFTDFSSSYGKGNWSTDTLDNGTYYIDFGVTDGYGSTDNCTVTIEVAEGTPTVPTNLNYALSNGNVTINWTWDTGSNTDKTNATLNGTAIGNITSPYEYTNNTLPRWENLSIRGYNSTTDEFSGWLNETVYVLAPTTPTLHIGNAINIKEDWGRDFNSNLSVNVTGANASGVWMNFSNTEFTNTSLGWANLTLNEWVNESHNVNSPVSNVSVDITLNSTTLGATNDTDSLWYEITKRTNTATMDSAGTQNVDTSETFYVNATCNEEYGDTFLGAANLLEDGTIIDTDTTVTNYVNFSWSESSAGQYNYTVRFYNLTHDENATTPTYSNVTVSDAEYIPPDATNLQNTTGNYYVNYTWVMGAPGNITDSYNVSWNLSWFNGTLTTYMQKEVGASNWGNITVYAYNSSGNGTLSSGSLSDNVQAPAFVPGDYIPATPTTLANSTGNYWVNFTWSSGGGANVTDSYNISWNATWYNTTLTAYMQKEVGPSNWGNITVYAYNTSGNGSLSAGYITDDVQAPAYVPGDYIPADPITLANTTGNYYVNYTWSTGGGVNNTDSYNVSWNLSWYNNTLTVYMQKEVGASNWGNITVYAFNSSGNGSLSAGSISDNVQAPAYVPTDYPPTTPTSLANTTGNSWVNYTWSSGGGANVTDSYNISWNLTWYNTTLVTYMNDSVGEFEWANISVWAYNSTGNGSLSAGSISSDTQAGGGTYTTTMTTTVYNLITYYGSTTSTAEQFGLDIGSVDYIAMYNGSFYSHTMGFSANNFTVYHGIGYYVYLNASGSSAYQRNNISDTPYNTQLFNRWNTIGWTNATDTNAEGVAASIGVACKYTSSLNADGVTYTTHTVGFTSNNHAVEKGEGYWVWVNTGVSWGRNS